MSEVKRTQYKSISESPGVYIMKNAKGEILYIGKAANLKKRVSSYFNRPNNVRIESMVSQIKAIETRETDSALEALILESGLIKKYQPPFNIREKDDTSFWFVVITKEQFPRVLSVRGKEVKDFSGLTFGPFVSASSIQEALKILRKIFMWHTHEPECVGKYARPCFEYEIGLCPGTCIGTADPNEYNSMIHNVVRMFKGKKSEIVHELEKKMKEASLALEFERANKIKKQIFALTHIRDTALINRDQFSSDVYDEKFRIEGYDISNISGTSAVGSMVVFENGVPNKNEYKKFKIKTIEGPNDVGMLREVIERRFKHTEWKFPDCVFVDGGKPQVNEIKKVLREMNIKIPVVGIAKGETRKKIEFIGTIPFGIEEKTLIAVRDEAHRFAIQYHRKLRSKSSFF